MRTRFVILALLVCSATPWQISSGQDTVARLLLATRKAVAVYPPQMVGDYTVLPENVGLNGYTAIPQFMSYKGKVSYIKIYGDAGEGTTVRAGIYTSAAGLPGTKIAQTNIVPVAGGLGWVQLDFASPPTIMLDTVWVVFEAEWSLQIYCGTTNWHEDFDLAIKYKAWDAGSDMLDDFGAIDDVWRHAGGRVHFSMYLMVQP